MNCDKLEMENAHFGFNSASDSDNLYIFSFLMLFFSIFLFDFFSFQYIGTLDVPRPSSRVEIVAAMRRIRVSPLNAPLPFSHPNPALHHNSQKSCNRFNWFY